MGRARRARHASAQAGRRALFGRGAGRVQSRQVDLHQRAAGDAASAHGHHAHDGAAGARHTRRARGRDGGHRKRRPAADRHGGAGRSRDGRRPGQGRRQDGRQGAGWKNQGGQEAARRRPPHRDHPPVAAAGEPADDRRHAGRQRHQRAARRHHLRLPAARGRGRVPAGRDADPDRLGAAVPGGAHPAFDARPPDLRGGEGRPARRGRAGRDAALRAPSPRGDRARAGDLPGIGQARAGGRSRRLGAGPVRRRAGRHGRARAAAAAARQHAGGRDAPVGVHPPEPGDPPAIAGAARRRAGGSHRARAGAAALRQEGAGERRRDRARRDRRAEGARAPGPGRLHRRAARGAGDRLETADAGDIRRYLSFFVQDTWKAWTEGRGSGSPPSWSGWPSR